MTIMLIGAFFPQLGETQRTHIRPGEICNFAAYAFVEAIVVVRRFTVFQDHDLKTSPPCRLPWERYPS